MNKKKKLFVALLTISGVTACVSAVGCFKHSHTFSNKWEADAEYHWHNSTCQHEEISDYGNHVFNNGFCLECGYKLYNKQEIFSDISLNDLCFGGNYKLNLQSVNGFTLKVWDEFGETELDDILELTDDMRLQVKGIIRRGYLNLFYNDEKIYQENLFFNIKTEQLTEKIRKYLSGIGVETDIIRQQELSKVKEIDLSQHFLNNREAIGGLKYITGLEVLNLSENELENSDIASLAEIKNLTRLDLSHNKITDVGVLKNNLKLQELDLSYNCLDTTDNKNSIMSLNRLSKLQKLNLENNKINDISPISNLTDITDLNLNSNKITPSSIDSIVGLSALKKICLGYNDGLSDLSSFYSLQYITNLNYIDLSGISLSGQFQKKFPTSTNLQTLIISDSSLQDSDLMDILKFNNLTCLDISANSSLSEGGLNSFFKSSTKLEDINLSSLNFIHLPKIERLVNLKSLTFDNCRNLYDINSLYNGNFPKLSRLSLNYCDSIKFSQEYTQHGMDQIIGKLSALKSVSMVDGIHWLTSETYKNIQTVLNTDPSTSSINANDLHLQLFEGETVSFENIANYPRKIYFSLSELIKDCTANNGSYTLKYDGKSKCVLSLVNDSAAKNNAATICLPNDFFEFSIYGTVNEEYNFTIKIEDRKRADFDLILDNCILNGNNDHTIIAANQSNVKITAKGERVEINAPEAKSDDIWMHGTNKNAISGYNLELVCETEKPLKIVGGRGVYGNRGLDSPTNRNITYRDRKGGKGGKGPAAITCNSLNIDVALAEETLSLYSTAAPPAAKDLPLSLATP